MTVAWVLIISLSFSLSFLVTSEINVEATCLISIKYIIEDKMIHQNTWRREVQDKKKKLIDHMTVDKRLKVDVMDA